MLKPEMPDLFPYFIINGNFTDFNHTNYTYFMEEQLPIEEGYGLSSNIQVILVLLYILTILLSIGGNVIVVYVVFALQRLRSVTNFFIVNLSCSDIVVAALCIPFTLFSDLIYYYWPFGSFLCHFVLYFQLVAVLQRAMTLVAMTIDRHYAIWRPLKRRLTKTEAKVIIIAIWLSAAVIASPTAIYTKITYLEYEPGNQGLCMETWENHTARYWYGVTIMLFQYFIPLAIMIGTYCHIGYIIWIKRPPGEADNNRDKRLAASKRKTVKMLIVVAMTYALCWLPIHVITILGDIDMSIYDNQYMHVIWLFSHWLAVSNCFSNPVIYFWMNSGFRQGFLRILPSSVCLPKRYSRHRQSADLTGFSWHRRQSADGLVNTVRLTASASRRSLNSLVFSSTNNSSKCLVYNSSRNSNRSFRLVQYD